MLLLKTGRYAYSNLYCSSRDDGEEGPHNPYKMRVIVFCHQDSILHLAANFCFATKTRLRNVSQTLKGKPRENRVKTRVGAAIAVLLDPACTLIPHPTYLLGSPHFTMSQERDQQI